MQSLSLPIHDALKHIGALQDDAAIDVFEAALQCAAVWHEGISLDRYRHHAQKVSHALEDIDTSQGEKVIRAVFKDTFGYALTQKNPVDIQNYDVIRMIERRTAAPHTIALFLVHCLRQAGHTADVIDFPKAAFCRVTLDGQRIILDPAQDFKSLHAADLRAHLKETSGTHAELSASYMTPVSNRAIVINLQNALKFRLIEMESYDDALKVIQTMRLIDPHEYKLLLEEGVLLARLNYYKPAIEVLRDYINRAPHAHERSEARQYLADLQSHTNMSLDE